jgi:hypothetical protein
MQNLRQVCIWSTFWLSYGVTYAQYTQVGKCILYALMQILCMQILCIHYADFHRRVQLARISFVIGNNFLTVLWFYVAPKGRIRAGCLQAL